MVRRFPITCRSRHHRQAGVTLIELLVVMAVLALAATIVLVNAPPRQSPAREAANVFAFALNSAIDDAVIGGKVYRLEVSNEKWRLSVIEEREWKLAHEAFARDGLELVVDFDVELRSNLLPLTGERPEARKREEPTIVPVDPFGDAPSFAVSFRGRRDAWTVRHDEKGDIQVGRE